MIIHQWLENIFKYTFESFHPEINKPEDHGLVTRGSSEPEDHGLVTRGSSEPEDHGLVTRSHLSSNNDLENILDILECNNNQS
jgi:hypothetical protein